MSRFIGLPEDEREKAKALARKLREKYIAKLAECVEWEPQPKQKLFLECQADEVLYGGAAGGGKSDALLMYSIIRRLTYPGTRGLILRRTLAELAKQGSLIPRAHQLLGGGLIRAGFGSELSYSKPVWKWRERDKTYSCVNGSVIEFGYCDDERDVYKWQSSQYEDICFDEATHFTEFQIKYLTSRCRSTLAGMEGIPNKFMPNPPPLRTQIRYASNPGNVGHNFFKRRFIMPAKPGEVWTPEPTPDDPEPRSRCYIPATVYDNTILVNADPSYIAWLRGLPQRERRMLLEGDWELAVGQFFDEWHPDIHVYDEATLPDNWPLYAGMDWGYNHPTVVLWAKVSPEGVMYVFDELRVRRMHVSEIAYRIRERHPHPVIIGAGSDVFSFSKEHVGGLTIAQEFAQHNVFLTNVTAGRRRHHMWQQVRKYLHWRSPEGEPIEGRPLLKVHRSCTNLIGAIPQALTNPDDPDDVLKVNADIETGFGGDDEVDALGYLCMTRAVGERELEEDRPPEGSFDWYQEHRVWQIGGMPVSFFKKRSR